MTMLGVAYELGLGVGRDREEALRWYERALALGDPGAMLHLARIALDGSNPSRAFALLQQAAAEPATRDVDLLVAGINRPRAYLAFQLARCWENGWGTAPDRAKAIELYRRAEAEGMSEAKAAAARLQGR